MRLLAIESATLEVGVALIDGDELLGEVRLRPGRRHVETLLPAVEALCELCSVPLDALDALAVDVGPGLFTSLRVGVAAVKGLAFARSLPVVVATSLEILGRAGSAAAPGAVVVPVVDVRRGELAWSLPGDEGPGRLGPPLALAAELARTEGELLLVGDGARRAGAVLAAALDGRTVRLGGDDYLAPPVATLARIGAQRLVARATLEASAVEPAYLRAPDAEANFAVREGAGERLDDVVPARGR